MANILMMDDDEDFAEAVALVLRSLGHQTQIAADLDAVRQAMSQHHPDLLILDMVVPCHRTEGLDLAKWLSGAEQVQNLPVLILADVDPNGALGFGDCRPPDKLPPHTDFLEKPVDLDVLIAHVQALLAA